MKIMMLGDLAATEEPSFFSKNAPWLILGGLGLVGLLAYGGAFAKIGKKRSRRRRR